MTDAPFKEELLHLNRNGRSMPVYIVGPDKHEQFPAVIIVHEIFGLNDHIKDIARRFARQGMYAYAPDLFAGYPDAPANRDDLDAMRTLWSSIPDADLIGDLQEVAALAKLNPQVHQDKVGTIGYCMGGAIAFIFACSTPGIRWVADYYGRIKYPQLTANKPKHPLDYADSLKSAVLGIFAGQDKLITADQITEFRKRLTESGQLVMVNVYDEARHAFFNDQREMYDKNAAEDAWSTTLKFITLANKTAAGGQ